MPKGIGRKYIGDMFATIGRVTSTGRKAASAASSAMGTSMPVGMRGSASSRLPAYKAARATQIKSGKNVVASGLFGVAGMNMMTHDRTKGMYRPTSQPINPISSPQGSGRYA
ncbi:hypothetical protein UFOVP784_58 [uncultured Caudovirales phage]|uniref:Uncharacterized protein n=1 Tax=uncultured Caudovirales phage TaxID=2100421 RepID=A0A6J5M8L4_9CAUD|nr:hypothetical protein UFOVP436_58 [uncultured Caudovirales phage]CAB4162539.1 hypothetical protein UFOVP784_58 [uncultured Caudovirales phage]